MEQPIIRNSTTSDPHPTMPPAPRGEICVRINSKMLPGPTQPETPAEWEHSYFFDDAEKVRQVCQDLMDFRTKAFVSSSKEFDVPPADEGWEYIDRDDPKQLTADKYLHKFHYRPLISSPPTASARG